MDPNSPQNPTSDDTKDASAVQPTEVPSLESEPAAPQPSSVITPAQPAETPPASPQPTADAQTDSATQLQDNHKILNEYGSPAFPTLAPAPPTKTKKSHLKLILILVAVLVVVLAGSAAAYFGYVVPNKPENIWKSALSNTGTGYDKLVEYSEKTEEVKDWTQEGSFKISGEIAADGTFEGKSSGDTGQFTGSVSAAGLKVGFDVRTLPSANSTPDIYFKADGIQGLGSLFGINDPQLETALNSVNNQWYVVDHTLFDQLGVSASETTSVTSDDVTAFLKAAGTTTKKYVFTDNADQSAVTLKEVVGKETHDGRSTYHYKASLNKTKTKEYLTALCDDLKSSKLGKSLDADSYKCSDFAKEADSIKESDTADAWVDTKTKLVQAVRFTETDNKANYMEISQNFSGGDAMPFKLRYVLDEQGEKFDGTLNVTLNTKTNAVDVDGVFTTSGSDEYSHYKGDMNFTIQPSKEGVKVEKPAGAKTIIELANDLGLGSLLSGSSEVLPMSDDTTDQVNEDFTDGIRLLFQNKTTHHTT